MASSSGMLLSLLPALSLAGLSSNLVNGILSRRSPDEKPRKECKCGSCTCIWTPTAARVFGVLSGLSAVALMTIGILSLIFPGFGYGGGSGQCIPSDQQQQQQQQQQDNGGGSGAAASVHLLAAGCRSNDFFRGFQIALQSIYAFFFGAMMVGAQAKIPLFHRHFNFLNTLGGRGAFQIFCGLFFMVGQWFCYIIASFILLCGCAHSFAVCYLGAEDTVYIEKVDGDSKQERSFNEDGGNNASAAPSGGFGGAAHKESVMNPVHTQPAQPDSRSASKSPSLASNPVKANSRGGSKHTGFGASAPSYAQSFPTKQKPSGGGASTDAKDFDAV